MAKKLKITTRKLTKRSETRRRIR